VEKRCTELGVVNSSVPDGKFVQRANNSLERLEEAKNLLRNNAATMGANVVRWDAATNDGSNVTGTAFRCP
jgi:hypothetical protein